MPVSFLRISKLCVGLTFLLIFVFIAGCSTSSKNNDDTTAPGAVSTSPAGTSSGAAINTQVSVSFNEAVVMTSFVLTSSHGATINGTVTGNGTAKITFTPDITLNYNTTYTATVKNVRDGSGNTLGDYSWSFTTTAAELNYHVTPDSHFYNVGTHNSIALSPADGRSYVSYFNITTKSLYIIATTDGTSFEGPYKIDGPNGIENVGEYSSLAIDSAGNLYVSYYHQNTGLKLATATSISGIWTKFLIDGGNVGKFSAIALGSADSSVHISYYDEANTALKYATNALGSWTKETLDTGLSSDNPGRYTSIKVDPDGFAHISYYDYHLPSPAINGNLKYVHGKSGNWSTPLTLDSTGDVGEFSSLGIYNGNIYIVYNHVFPDGTRTIRIINNASGDWKHQDITQVSLSPFDQSITANPLSIDPAGVMHVSYYYGGDLYYASGVLFDAASNGWDWATGQLVDGSEVGQGVYTSIVADANGKVSIAYYDATDGDLKYAQ